MATPFELFQPHNSALIIVDKQNAYMNQTVLERRGKSIRPDFDQRIANMERVIRYARRLDILTIWTQMTEHIDESPSPIALKMAYDKADGARLISAKPGTSDFEFYGASKPAAGELVLPKRRYDSFSNPDLNTYLDEYGRNSVIIIGGFASRCVLATAFGANSHDKDVMVVNDAVVSPAQYADEESTMFAIIDGILGYQTTTDELLANWQANLHG
jgi:ureidoacrylate peracid hydrolase